MPINLNLPDGSAIQVEPTQPIILLGPNGVGKTRFAVNLVQRNNPSADRISANRHIGLTNLPRQADTDLKNSSQNAIRSQLAEYWDVHNEYTYLMAEILEEDKSASQKFKALTLEKKEIPKELIETRLQVVTRLWQDLFPGRTLKLDYTPLVTRADQNPYPTAQMSEGERTALYLITRLVSTKASIVIVDEPEIHFHPLLAREFWNHLEDHKKDVLFIYVTHDIPFALSRTNPKLLVIRSPNSFDEILGRDLPTDAIDTILGAASFSISATRLIFCEGKIDGYEHRFFSSWYNCPRTAVIPVGGCEIVRKCVEVFNSNHATKNVTAHGHIDRDDWSDDILNSQPKVRPLPINEIEGIIRFEPVFKALAVYQGFDDGDARFTRMLDAARTAVKGTILNKHALNRAKLVLELKQQAMRNAVKPNADFALMRTAYLAAVTTPTDADAILTAEIATLNAALGSNDLLLKFPSKTYHAAFTPQIGLNAEKAFDDICKILATDDEAFEKEDLSWC